jgi:hypothetical protein
MSEYFMIEPIPSTATARHSAVTGPAEDDPAEHRRGGVVHVHGGLLGTDERLDRPLDELLARLGQHRDPDVVGHSPALDEAADEIEVGLRCGRETDLDLLVAHLDEQIEHRVLACGVHRVDQCLVSVAQVCREPARGVGDGAARPLPVRQIDGGERGVAVARHTGGLLLK